MARRLHVNTAQTSSQELEKIARKSGFEIFQGAKHLKVKTRDSKFVTLIPRHDKISRPTAKSIIEAMNSCGANITFS